MLPPFNEHSRSPKCDRLDRCVFRGMISKVGSRDARGGRKRRKEEGGGRREEEEGLYLRIETRKRAQTNEAKSKRRRASPTKTTGRRDNTPASRCLPSRRVLLARKGYRQPITPQGLQGWRAHPKRWPCQGHQPQQWCERTRHPCWRGMEHAWDPQGCAARPAKKIEGVEPHPIIPCVYYDELPRLDALAPKGRVIGGGDDGAVKETR